MIPKTIHYCWFGGNPLPELAQKCIESWKKFCPDYEIIQWDETNFDVNQNDYCREAYETKKWAFVSDYARLKVLYEYGGIYMDTDVEVIKNLDCFLENIAFVGFESKDCVQTGLMAAERNGEWIKLLLSSYDDRKFILDDGKLDLTTNVIVTTAIMRKNYNLELNNSLQEVEGVYKIYPSEYFCAKDYITKELKITDNTHTIHHYDGSWASESWKWRSKFIQKYYKFLGKTGARYLSLVIYCIKENEWKQIGNKIRKRIRKAR